MLAPRGFVKQGQLAIDVERAKRKLGPNVVRLKHSIGDDTSGEPAIYFRVVLTDSASQEETLAEVTGQIASSLFDDLRPYENWGLTPYFTFRSQSEQSKRNDPDWS